ncbi:serine palmitoyltransferase component [Friedmanniomyces endolithicus]|uniref:Serine palmitoyltransferase component n=1 Tax=Friedmanniomyces endolithicus TaxID=329885 RepID=A0AAN6JDH9_9PEZI|nr:serine palmitoyltransferase component [Friedmanniomyces endolithicus]
MPYRTLNPFATFAASAPTLSSIGEIDSEKESIYTETREAVALKKSFRPRFNIPFVASTPKAPRVVEITTPQTRLEPPSIGAFRPPSPQIPTLSLPTINLTTATGEKSKMEENTKPLTLFQPPTPAEAKRIAKQHAAFGPLGSKQHLDFDNFYIRRLQLRINDCFRRPVTGVPGRFITLLDRTSDDFNLSFKLTGTTTETLNMSSYNYLGFAQADGECADAAELCMRKYGISFCSSRADIGTSDLHLDVEKLVANFVGKEAATIHSMGFVTNASVFPALVGKGCLLISDQLNHASIRFGARISGSVIDMFKHNDMMDLERVLRERISQGQPRTHRPWRKILVAVEGLYSMEGTMCNLPGLVALKKKYKFALYVDEAHSIGALGPRGRGVCDYFGIDPKEIDILMGTFTKSFGANGGYICATKAIIDKIRVTNAGTIFGETPAPAVLTQIATSLKIIAGDIAPGQGEERLQRLAFNSRYLRLGLKRLGFIVYGHDDSPIIPLLLYHPAKIPAFSREMLKRKISVVVVGYPATPLISSRVRLCVSAAHTKDDLDRLLAACDQAGEVLQLKFSSGIAGGQEPPIEDELAATKAGSLQSCLEVGEQLTPPRWRLADIVKRGVQDVKQPLF